MSDDAGDQIKQDMMLYGNAFTYRGNRLDPTLVKVYERRNAEADQRRRREIFRNDQLERIANALWVIAVGDNDRYYGRGISPTQRAIEIEAAYNEDREAAGND